MIELYLTRLITTENQTLGFLTYFDKILKSYFSLELPDKENKPNISRILPGTYNWRKWYSPHFKMTVIRLENVPGRSDILIHPANFVGELRGCIAIGLKKADINGDGVIDVASSRSAVKELVSLLPDKGKIHIE